MGGEALGEKTLPAEQQAKDSAKSGLPGKLRPPRLRGTLMRPRLMPQIFPGSGPQVVNICAGPGYGKTTLMAQIAKIFDGKSVWYQVGSQDRDPAVFLRHLTAGVNHALGKGESHRLSRFGNAANIVRDGENIIMALIDELSEHPADSLLLCFDDFHLFSQKDRVPHLIDILAQNLPENVGIIIASREAPKLSLGRLRSQGLLSDIRERDLEFSFDELSDLMYNWDIEASEATLHQVHKSTGGWAAGLVLMENHLRSSDEIPDLFADRQIQQNVYEYLAEEVLQALPEEMQDFLKRVSLVDPIEPAICSAALGIEGAGKMLAQAERSNLFTSCLDDVDSYRFHPLFKDFLLTHFRREQGEEVQKLRISFAQAYKRSGKKREAIHQFLEADCHKEAVELIEEIGEEMLNDAAYKTLEEWFVFLNLADLTPALKTLNAYTMISRGKYHQALKSLESTERELQPEDLYLTCRLRMGMAECFRELGESDEAIEILRPFLENKSLPPALKLEVVYRLSSCYLVRFDLEGIYACNELASKIDIAHLSKAPNYELMIAVQYLHEGDFPNAEKLHSKMYSENNYRSCQSVFMNNRASCLMMVGKYEEALIIANKCNERVKQMENSKCYRSP